MKNSKVFRDRFVSSHLSHTLALQIRTLREARELTQKDLGDKIGTPQTGIARLEKIGYEKYNLSTLKRLASAFDVGLVVQFVPYNEVINRSLTVSPEVFAISGFQEESEHEFTGTTFVTVCSNWEPIKWSPSSVADSNIVRIIVADRKSVV